MTTCLPRIDRRVAVIARAPVESFEQHTRNVAATDPTGPPLGARWELDHAQSDNPLPLCAPVSSEVLAERKQAAEPC
jgi:hypothetical protein